MEENDIVPLNEEEKDSFVLVERNRTREKARLLSYFKRGLLLLLLVGVCFGAYKLFPHVKSLWNKMPWVSTHEQPSDKDNGSNGATPPSTNTSTSTNEGNSDNLGSEDNNATSYKINTIGALEYKPTNESGCDFDFSLKHSVKSLDEIYSKYGSDAPVVLIMHSNLRESYSNGIDYSTNSAFYSDENNASNIGDIICQVLNSEGVNAIHISELYASGSIYGSRDEYEKALTSALKKYPSITYVFNISRGLSINDDMTMNKSLIKEGEKAYAQISITSGTDWDKATENQNNNVLFAFDFSKYANAQLNNIVKENKISRFSLSQDFGPISANVDIGEYSNSYEEAKNTAEAFAILLTSYLKEG